MPTDLLMRVGTWALVSDGDGFWGYVRMILSFAGIAFLLWVWLCKLTIKPEQHGLRESFGVIKFDYFNGREGLERLHWYKAWRKSWWREWWTARKTRRDNRRKAKKLRNSEDGNKPHLLMFLGDPRLYGPGWYTTPPGQKAISFRVLDTRNRFLELVLYVRKGDQYDAFLLPIQIVVRIANLYLWDMISNGTEGGIVGIAKRKARLILDLGHDTILNDADAVADCLMKALGGPVGRDAPANTFGWYGAEIIAINPAAVEYVTAAWVADALSKMSPKALADFKKNGIAVDARVTLDNTESPKQSRLRRLIGKLRSRKA